jgi:tRNA modification GTPase
LSFSSQAPRELDTIAAIATPGGEGGIGIVRLSGARAVELADRFFRARSGQSLKDQPSFTARLGRIVRPDGRVVDETMALVMRAPKTYTREDMVEIHAHGGPVVLRSILDLAVGAGARTAEPGEFTKRAFLSGRIDLLQAEAVLDLIHAKSEMGRAFASSQLGGALSAKIAGFRETLIDILSHLEADIDFPEDFPEPQAAARLRERLAAVSGGVTRLLESSALGFVAQRGVRAVIWGRPNVGKSSLLNALSRKNRVIVTPHPGTTRDVIEEEIELAGFPVRLVDTAGVQETSDPIEREGVARSRLALLAADVVLHVIDSNAPLSSEDGVLLEASAAKPRLLVLNKADLPAGVDLKKLQAQAGSSPLVRVSCVAENGLQALEEALGGFLKAGRALASDEPVVSSIRQKEALDKVRRELEQAVGALQSGLSAEFPAADIRRALAGLAELTGEITNDEVLDRLFNQFCIGK